MSELFNDELLESSQKIKDINSKINNLKQITNEQSNQLADLYADILRLAENQGISLEGIIDPNATSSNSQQLKWEDEFFLNDNLLKLEPKIREEVFRNPKLLPNLSSLEYAIIGISGLVAALIDILIVKIPKDISYLGQYQQQGSQFTAWLRSLGIDSEGKLNPFLKWSEAVCKVPYDQSINPDIKGFNPKNHRLLSLSHDPLFGLIFGILDILNGTMTAFDIKGNLHIIKTFDPFFSNKVFSPFLWLGHIISDLCTKMGIPIPGWGFLQLLQFGSFGSKHETIADISRWMYLNGYDLRHFVTMSIPVAVIEIIIRIYHYLSLLDTPDKLQDSLYGSVASQEITKLQSHLKLHKMLFLSHALATSGNAIKIFAYSGNPLAINLPQWSIFIKEGVEILQAMNRDTTPEKIVRNRNKINQEWEEIRMIKLEGSGINLTY